MDFRYQLPSQSKALVFFSIDDDVNITCEELRKSFKVWRSSAVGDLGPLVSYLSRGYNFLSYSSKFTYQASS
jgi:hypothetical protein